MIIALLLAATATSAPAPVLHFAETRSVAYRNCIVAEHRQKPALTVEQIGKGRCAQARAKLFDAAHTYVRYGWRAVPKSGRQAKALKAQHKLNAEAEIVRFESAMQYWIGVTEAASAGH